jgi:heme exporter protein A
VFDRVDLCAVVRTYGPHRALAGAQFTLRAGRLCALLGANGAGKSTLLKVLSTLMRPTTGEVRFGDIVATSTGCSRAAELRAAIGLVSHESLLYGELTGEENLRLYAGLYGVRERQRIAELLRDVELTSAAQRPVRSYSRGMVQRLGIARALLHRPRLLLLDEPFTGLDREGVDCLRRLLELGKEAGQIQLAVTHDFGALDGLVEHVVVVRRGRVVAERHAEPPSRFTATDLVECYGSPARAASPSPVAVGGVALPPSEASEPPV